MFKPKKAKGLKLLPVKPFAFLSVIPLGLEPKTHTLKVYCSTN
jgi:hypothetical protein